MTAYFLTYLYLIPGAALCLFPMRNQLKYGCRLTVAAAGALLAVAIPLISLLNYSFSLAPNTLLFATVPGFFAAYCRALRVHISKALAVFCSVIVFLSILADYAACFDAVQNPALGADSYTTEYTLFQFQLAIAAAAVCFYPMWKYGSRLIDELNSKTVWYLTVPFSALFFVMNLCIRAQKYETYYDNQVFIAALSLLTGFLLTWVLLHVMFYFMVIELLNAEKERERVRLLEMQESQYVAQQRYMEDSARTRHDFRQTIRTLQELAQAKNFDSLTEFINRYAESLPESDVKAYCRNLALNALLNYYVRLAERSGIRMKIQMRPPEAFRMTDPDLCGMTGNILENAIAACQGVPEQERSVQLQSRVHNDMYFIIVATNTFNGNVRMKNGEYLSTHKNGRGIGLSSIRSTAEKYGGTAEFSHDATQFYTNIMIPVPANRPFSD